MIMIVQPCGNFPRFIYTVVTHLAIRDRNLHVELFYSCRTRNVSEYDLVGGDEPGCNFNSILHMTELQYRDIIHISYHNQVPDMYVFWK